MSTAHAGSGSGPRVVVPVDLSHGSWRVLPLARSISRRLGAQIMPVFVDVSTLGSHAVLDHSMRLVASVDGAAVSIDVVPGTDVAATVRRVLDGCPDSSLMLAIHGLGGFAGTAGGSVSLDLLSTVDAAIIVLGPGYGATATSDLQRVVALVDPATPDELVVDDAAQWARRLDLPLVIATVCGHVRPGGSISGVAALATAARAAGTAVTTCGLHGHDPVAAVVDFAARHPGSLVAFSVEAGVAATILAPEVTVRVAHDLTSPMLVRGCRGPTRPIPAQRNEQDGRSERMAANARS